MLGWREGKSGYDARSMQMAIVSWCVIHDMYGIEFQWSESKSPM